jgi:hypothetical protein
MSVIEHRTTPPALGSAGPSWRNTMLVNDFPEYEDIDEDDFCDDEEREEYEDARRIADKLFKRACRAFLRRCRKRGVMHVEPDKDRSEVRLEEGFIILREKHGVVMAVYTHDSRGYLCLLSDTKIENL